MALQPLLHDLLPATMAPTQAWSGRDGQIRPVGAQGLYHADVRVLSEAVLTVSGQEPESIAAGAAGPGAVEVVSLLRTVADAGADPGVRLRRTRRVAPGEVRETLEVANATGSVVVVPFELRVSSDLMDLARVKAGLTGSPRPAELRDGELCWTDGPTRVTIRPEAPEDTSTGTSIDASDPAAPVLHLRMTVPPGVTQRTGWTLRATGADAAVGPPVGGDTWVTPRVEADDKRLPRLLSRALEDLRTLRMTASFAPDDVFVAAGAPWFFTLFGRDSIWAARMMLSLGTELAGGTLRALAARQGRVDDPDTAEQPGKILHELRGKELPLGDEGRTLPPLYYGTVDATPLWVCLLHDAWRWGMPADEVEALLPAMEAALGWVAEHGDADGDGFLEYHDSAGRGLANQGWKDSGDSVQWRDGRLADGPIALCEVQGYAHEAALGGADLLEAFGRPGAAHWRRWAADLADRFRERFWVADADGPYPAIALDRDKRAVDALTSNIGHLLGTGLLSTEEEKLVARRLGSPALDSGYGLRTMATGSAGYWPMRYHGGTVWTHDTAIAVAGLVRSGHGEVGARLVEGLLAAASELDFRLPELHSGDARGTVPAVVPYPAACRPQAWAAASAVVLLSSVLGLRPDVPGGTLRIEPMSPSPVGAVAVSGLRLGGHDLAVELDAAGRPDVVRTAAPVQIR